MDGGQESKSLLNGLVKRVVAMTVRFPPVWQIWADSKSSLSPASQGHKVQKQGVEVKNVTEEAEVVSGDAHDDKLCTEGTDLDVHTERTDRELGAERADLELYTEGADREFCTEGAEELGFAEEEQVHTAGGAEELSSKGEDVAFQDAAGTSLECPSDDRVTSLPEELIERILAMVPFPQVWKALVLSKSWQARFTPIESQSNEEKKRLAISFQKQVCEQSINWRLPCPFFIDSHQRFLAYESASDSWPKVPSLSFLPLAILCKLDGSTDTLPGVLNHHSDPQLYITWLELVDGGLLLAGAVTYGNGTADYDKLIELESPLNLHVANLFTRTWRQLPRLPPVREFVGFVKMVSLPALDKYKVIVFHRSRDAYYFAQCYDSKLNSWRRTTSVHIPSGLFSATPLAGVLYMKVWCNGWTRLVAFDVEEETFEELELLGMGSCQSHRTYLAACNGNLLMAVKVDGSPATVQVLKIDLITREVSEVTRGPPAALTSGRFNDISIECVSDGVAALCFRLVASFAPNACDAMVVYDMRTDEWHYVALSGRDKWLDSSSQPICNPFVAV